MTQIEPCRCGWQPEVTSSPSKRGNYFVRCISCGHTVDDGDNSYTKDEAILSWNYDIRERRKMDTPMTQDAMRESFEAAKLAVMNVAIPGHNGMRLLGEVFGEDLIEDIVKAAHQSREAEVQRLREALEKIAEHPLTAQYPESIARQALTPAKESENNHEQYTLERAFLKIGSINLQAHGMTRQRALEWAESILANARQIFNQGK